MPRLPEEGELCLGEIANVAKEGLLVFARAGRARGRAGGRGAGVGEVVGPKGRHDSDRRPKRHGQTGDEVTLGGRHRRRPAEIELASYARMT